jgi:hemin uptake protein HemP
MKNESGIGNRESGMKKESPLLAPPGGERKVLRSEEIFGESREVVIRHREQEYRLQVTRNGKLILIK